MVFCRLIAFLLLALTLVVNSVVAPAMAANMSFYMTDSAAVAPKTHCGNTSAVDVADHEGSATEQHCCDDGRCACACTYGSNVVMHYVAQRWLAAAPPSMLTPSRLEVISPPLLRPPIAPIS